MTARTPQQIGRSNRRDGSTWQEDCASYLRETHYPHAEYVKRNGANDLSGTGDIAVECTRAGWDQIWIKLDQAHRDAKYRGLEHAVVWKRYVNKDTGRGKSDPGAGAIVMLAAEFWPLMADLEAYQRAEMDYVNTWEKAFAAGFKAASETPATLEHALGEDRNRDTA